jgi:hypothetical protein
VETVVVVDAEVSSVEVLSVVVTGSAEVLAAVVVEGSVETVVVADVVVASVEVPTIAVVAGLDEVVAAIVVVDSEE